MSHTTRKSPKKILHPGIYGRVQYSGGYIIRGDIYIRGEVPIQTQSAQFPFAKNGCQCVNVSMTIGADVNFHLRTFGMMCFGCVGPLGKYT